MNKSALIILLAVAGIPTAARADLILGTLNATGTAVVKLGSINFLDNELDINSPAAAQEGGFKLLAGTKATITDLTNPPDAVGPLDVPDFVTFTAAPNISFTLTFLVSGINGAAGCTATPPAAGQKCTPDQPDQSQYNLFNNSTTSSTASFNILGTEVNSVTGESTGVTGIFTEPFTSQNYQQILATILSGGQITTAFAAQFATVEAPAPEPGTLVQLMIGFSAVAIGMLRRKSPRRD